MRETDCSSLGYVMLCMLCCASAHVCNARKSSCPFDCNFTRKNNISNTKLSGPVYELHSEASLRHKKRRQSEFRTKHGGVSDTSLRSEGRRRHRAKRLQNCGFQCTAAGRRHPATTYCSTAPQGDGCMTRISASKSNCIL